MKPPLVVALGFVLVSSAAAGAQHPPVPNSAFLEWRNLRLVISPDIDGIYVWASSQDLRKPKEEQFFGGTFPPAEIITWTADARWFLDQKLDQKDTAAVRTSPRLRGRGGDAYLVRRKHKGEWTNERFIVMESPGIEPVIINGVDGDAREIIDSLEAVARRAPLARMEMFQSLRELVAESRDSSIDESASLKADTRPLAYPEEERRRNHEGIVLLSFVVGTNGEAQVSTLRVVHSTSREFLKSTLDALPRLRFNPARSKGQPVPQRVIVPFAFKLRP